MNPNKQAENIPTSTLSNVQVENKEDVARIFLLLLQGYDDLKRIKNPKVDLQTISRLVDGAGIGAGIGAGVIGSGLGPLGTRVGAMMGIAAAKALKEQGQSSEKDTTPLKDSAKLKFLEALRISRKIGDQRAEALAWYSLAVQEFFNTPDYGHILEYLEKASRLWEQNGLHFESAMAFAEIGMLYYQQKELDKAADAFSKCLDHFSFDDAHQDDRVQAQVAYLLGRIYVDQGRLFDGLHLLEKSRKIRRLGNDSNVLADTIYQLARTHHLLKNFDAARIHFRDALRLYTHTKNKAGIAACKVGLGRLFLQSGFASEAVKDFEEAREIYRELKSEKAEAEVESLLQLALRIREKIAV